MTYDYDAIVIGSGLGGSSAAAHLAAVGRRVLLLERYSVLGGSSHVFRRQGKWEFDCGVHYVGDCGPHGQVPTLLHGLGLDDRISWLPLDPAGFDIVTGPDLELKVPHGWDAYEANLIAAFPEDAAGLRRMVAIMKALSTNFDRDLTPANGYGQWIRKTGPVSTLALLPLIAVLTLCGLKPRTMLAVSAQCGALATMPTTMATVAFAQFLGNYVGGGASYPRGGGQILAAGFAEVVTSHGGTIRRNAAVERILLEDGRVRGVRLADGEVISAPAVVSAGDVIRTYTELVGVEHLPRHLWAQLRTWRMSRPLINGFFGIELDLSDALNANYYAIPTWDDATDLLRLGRFAGTVMAGRGFDDGAAWASQVAARQPMFVQSSSRRDPGHAAAAPPGCATVEVQTITPYAPTLWGFSGYDVASGDYRSDRAYQAVKDVLMEGMAARIEQAFPGSSARVRFSELGSPATQERYVGNTGGAPFGLAVSPGQVGPLRPGTKTAIPGLYLAGTSTAWGPGTEGAMLSGRQAASAIVGRDLSAEVRAGAVLVDRSSLRRWEPGFDPLTATSSALGKAPARGSR
ncbi:phytoene desaturase family protein [Nocardia rhizosphaerihabitans]|uniref:phytoene desaturase family protein n=1 Tax=Nocardia rhizosphaerihabitans TaxID=1691570 RepID=UPI00366E174F